MKIATQSPFFEAHISFKHCGLGKCFTKEAWPTAGKLRDINTVLNKAMQLDSIIDNLPVPAVVIDERRRIRILSRLFRRYALEVSHGKHILASVGEDIGNISPDSSLRRQLQEFADEVLRTDGTLATDFEIPSETDRPNFGRFLAHRIVTQGAVSGALFLRLDVTQSVTHEREALHSGKLLRALGEQLRDVVVFTDIDGTIIDCNPAALQTLRYVKEDLMGRPLADLSAEAEGQPERFRRLLNDGGGDQGFRRVLRSDGSELVMDVSTAVIKNEDRKVMSLIGRDVSEQLQVERNTEKLQRLESLGILAGGLAHDFNNLLMGIGGRLSLAAAHTDAVGDLPRILAEAEAAVVQATRLTEQLLTFAKGGEPVKEPLELDSLIRSEAKFAASGSNVDILFEIEDELWPVLADRGQLRQVVQNLVVNAVQATDDQGSIRVRARNKKVSSSPDVASKTTRSVELQFADDGPGISEEIQELIFDPYFSTKGSSGLGLATIHSIIARHGGTITVDSSPGSGASFTILLPAQAPDPATLNPAVVAAPTAKDPPPLRVLFMDDDQSLRALLTEFLEILGHESEAATNGEAAVAIYQAALNSERPFDVVILDVTVRGGMGGLEAGATLLELTPDIPILLASGYNKEGIQAQSPALGFAGYLPKPFGLKMLRAALADVSRRTHRSGNTG